MAFVEPTGPDSWRVRYWTDTGVHGSICGFSSETEARAKAAEIDTDRRRGTFIDPAAGKLAVGQWASTWFEALDVGPATDSQYRCLYRCHIAPRWGRRALGDVSGTDVHIWARKLRTAGYADSTVASVVKLLSMMLADAAAERLIAANPIRPQRRGRRVHRVRRERLWATPEQVLQIALGAVELAGGWAGLLIVTGAWTGARWGELLGLRRHNLHLTVDRPRMVIDPDTGSLHEVDGRLFLGPPKTAESARTITLPRFLVELLTRHLDSHTHPHVFCTEHGEHPRRSNFARRVMRPAADGTHTRPRAPQRLDPVAPGLTFHGLRHSHKTWMIADHVPQVAQARRLGHTMPDKIEDIYSHVAAEVDTHLLTCLQQRWDTATAALTTTAPATTSGPGLELMGREWPAVAPGV
ncbi:MAG: tyrosine-type recombinase/integrase [Acidimicrobiales bacterium]|nr:tyrosine-type recombinase/integrase [Acidimicrobiales bacterium]